MGPQSNGLGDVKDFFFQNIYFAIIYYLFSMCKQRKGAFRTKKKKNKLQKVFKMLYFPFQTHFHVMKNLEYANFQIQKN